MTFLVRGLAVATIALGMGMSLEVANAQQLLDQPSGIVPGEIIVGFKPLLAGASARANILSNVAGARVKANLLLPNAEVISVPVGEEAAAAAELAVTPGVAFAEPNRYVHAFALPNDPRFSDLWGLNNTGQTTSNLVPGTNDADIDAPEAWSLAAGVTNRPLVAIIDTGIRMDHPDLAGQIYVNPGEFGGGKDTNGIDDDGNGKIDDWRGWDFVNNDNNPTDDHEHGTHVAGTIGGIANNGLGVAGVASFPTASGPWLGPLLMGVKVLNAAGSGTTTQVVNGMTYAGMMGAKVANMSLGASGSTSPAEDAAIAAYPNTLFVIAAGNGGTDGIGDNNDTVPSSPCVSASTPDQPNKICVAATDSNDALAGFSNYGLTTVDLSGPGVNVLSSVPYSFEMQENFETDLTHWVTNDAGQVGPVWDRVAVNPQTGTYSVTDSPAANYAGTQNNWIRNAAAFDLTGKTSCSFGGYVKLVLTSPALFYVEAGTSSTGPFNTSVAYTSHQAGTFSLSLSSFNGAPAVYVRLRVVGNGGASDDGVYVDNLNVTCTPTVPDSTTSYDFFNGTSMATPHVAGAAAFLFAMFPAESVAQIEARILNGVDHIPSLNGKTVTGGRLNLYNAATGTAPPVNSTLTVSASPPSGGGVSGGGTFATGSSVTVVATANSGYDFSAWTESGVSVSTAPSYTFTLSGNRSLVGVFTARATNSTLTVSASPAAGGTVSGGGTFVTGSSVTIVAAPNSGYNFTAWTEGGLSVSTSQSYTFTLNANHSLVGVFTPRPASALFKKGGKITFAAARGLSNNLIVTPVNVKGVPFFLFSDPYSKPGKPIPLGSRIVPTMGCVAVTVTSARCPAAGISQILISTGDLSDTVDARKITIPLKIDGGDGDDILRGGTAGDILTGGRGRDSFYGGGGDDTIKAKDDEKDLKFSCGAGNDNVLADLSPNDPVVASPADCEVVVKKP